MDKCEALSTKPEECRYSFMQHTACEFFPCHKTAHPEDFNCLFCYCPLYTLGDQCGGNFAYIGDGIKEPETAINKIKGGWISRPYLHQKSRAPCKKACWKFPGESCILGALRKRGKTRWSDGR